LKSEPPEDQFVTDPLDPLDCDRTNLVRGTVALDEGGPDTPAAVLATALWTLFEDHEPLRRAAAVQRHLAGEASRGDLTRLAGLHDAAATAVIVERHREVCEIDAEGSRPPALEAVAAVDEDAASLAVGASALAADGVPDDPTAVVDVAVGYFFQRHEALRHAATATLYATTSMSTGGAAMMAGVSAGPEICSLLRDHGVTPRVGPGPVRSSDDALSDDE
jgi:hypothetical protein